MIVRVVERRRRVQIEKRQPAHTVAPGHQFVVRAGGPGVLGVVAREQDRDGMQVVAGQSALPVVRVVTAGVPEDVGAGGHALAERVGEAVASESSGTPSARSPFHVKPSVTQRLVASIVSRTDAADSTTSVSSDSQARPPAGLSNDRNS